jgi:DNA-binding response OmpR family regulator
MNRHILVSDASRVIRTLLQIYLQQAGYRVLLCSNPQEAFQILLATPEAPELLFLAVHASSKGDVELIRFVRTRAKYAQTTLVAMVLPEEQAKVQRSLRETNVSYLLKPFRVQEALALVSASQACRPQESALAPRHIESSPLHEM